MNPLERLRAGRDATQQGRYDDALKHFLWFHDHALEEDESWRGVRLSFALHDWMNLAAVHPPAMQAFRERRDAQAKRLREGEQDRDALADVAAMSEQLDEDEVTAELFAMLHKRRPAFASRCADIARPILVRRQQFDLALATMPEPRAHIRALASTLIGDIERIESRPRARSPRFKALTGLFADDLSDVLTVLRATGHGKLANELQVEALGLLPTKSILQAVTRGLRVKA